MEEPDFTVEHLKQLPLRAMVAFAARCARRVEPLAQLPEGDPGRESRRAALDAALRLAEEFAAGAETPPDPSVVAGLDAILASPGDPITSRDATASASAAAHAAASAWRAVGVQEIEHFKEFGWRPPEDVELLDTLKDVSIEIAALDAYTAAEAALDAVGYRNEDFVTDAITDYNRLLRLNLGRYPNVGVPTDPSPAGPLGPL